MIWLTSLGGAGPISSTGSPITTVTISGVSWKLYKGMNGAMSKSPCYQTDLYKYAY